MQQDTQFGFGFADHSADVDAQIDAAIRDPRMGPHDDAYRVLRELRTAKGSNRALPLARIGVLCNMGERRIKAAVRELVVDFQLPIVGSRGAINGYYFAVTADEAKHASETLEHEMESIAARVKALNGEGHLREVINRIGYRLCQTDF